MHIKGENGARLCASPGTFEQVGEDKDLTLCPKCAAIHLTLTGEGLE